ncbi:hypothetical protein BN1708_017959, partial [Verticillium longisporum]
MQTVSDSKEFVSSILRGVKEVQFAVSFVGLTKKVDTVKPNAAPVLLNASMKEVSQRRGFIYYLSRPAVKFIIDIVEEQYKAKFGTKTANGKAATDDNSTDPSFMDRETQEDIEERIK